MKLSKNFILHEAGGQTMLVPTGSAGFSGLVKGNKTLGAVLACLKSETTEEDIIKALKARFDAPEGAVERDVAKALEALRKIGAIDE